MLLSNRKNKIVKVEATDLENVDLTSGDWTPKKGETHAGLYINTAGNVKLTMLDGKTDTFPLGSGYHPICCTKIFKTGTTATGIIAYY